MSEELDPRRTLLLTILNVGKEVRSYINYRWINITIALQIRAMRKQRKWSQAELAKRAGLTVLTIVRIEKLYWGKIGFSTTTLMVIASAFDVGLEARFAPWVKLVDDILASPHLENGLSSDTFNIPTFTEEVGVGDKSDD